MAKVKKETKSTKYIKVLKELLIKEISAKFPFLAYKLRMQMCNNVIKGFKKVFKTKASKAKDRKYTSNQKHEVKYSKKRKSKILKYKKKK